MTHGVELTDFDKAALRSSACTKAMTKDKDYEECGQAIGGEFDKKKLKKKIQAFRAELLKGSCDGSKSGTA